MNRLALIYTFFLAFGFVRGQSLQIGASISGSNYSGDLTRDNLSVVRQTNPGFGLEVNYWLDAFVGFKLQYERLKVSADDGLSQIEWQKKRNLNFFSRVHSFDAIAELNLASIVVPSLHKIKLSLLGGYSFFGFNPKAILNNKEYSLQELGTEGQGMKGYRQKYALHSTALNFGISMEVNLFSNWMISSQILFRKTNTDYLDDISSAYVDYNLLSEQNGILAAELGNKIKAPQGSQRGNPIDNDWYQSLNLGIHYKLFDKNNHSTQNRKHHFVHCPKIR